MVIDLLDQTTKENPYIKYIVSESVQESAFSDRSDEVNAMNDKHGGSDEITDRMDVISSEKDGVTDITDAVEDDTTEYKSVLITVLREKTPTSKRDTTTEDRLTTTTTTTTTTTATVAAATVDNRMTTTTTTASVGRKGTTTYETAKYVYHTSTPPTYYSFLFR